VKLFFYVQHLLGIGHLRRASVLARSLAAAGFDVTLASGGLPVANVVPQSVRLVQLPPAAAEDASFRQLVDANGRRVDDAWKSRRKEALLTAFETCSPEILLVELFPFGRRQMRFELLPLLERAAGRCRIACSVRDLIQGKPGREEEMLALAARFFDRILVHGDPRLASFPLASRLGGKLHYTGYVVEDLPIGGDAGKGEVLVSAGGGAVGGRLLETAILARPMTALRDRTWRVIAGINGPDLSAFQQEGIVIEKMRQDFTTLLGNCELSVSQAGYNTVMETLQARARAVLVPFAGEGEAEQATRARLLGGRGLVEVVDERTLDPAGLAAAVDRAAARPRPGAAAVDLDGARRSAALLMEWAHG
jgi:predicted glycosyltransferase